MKRILAVVVAFSPCAMCATQTNVPGYEYAPPAQPPSKPSPWLPYGPAGVPEQILRWIFLPVQWAAATADRHLAGVGTSPLSYERPSSGLYPLARFTPAQGFGLGVGYFDENFAGHPQLLRLEGEASTDDVEQFRLSLAFPFAPGMFECGARFDRDANSEFYGFGNRSRRTDRGLFEWIEADGWVSWKQPLPAGFSLGAGAIAHALTFDANGGEDDPRIGKKFVLATVPGFQADPDLVELTAALSHRSPTNWTVVAFQEDASISRFETLSGGDFDFLSYSLASGVTIPLGKPHRELRLGARWEESRADGGNQVPFVYQPVLGENTGLRGFDRNRFRDRAAALAHAEYRFPTWPTAQGIFFYDLGRVFGGIDEFRFESWRWSAGFGAEIETPSRFHVRLMIGFSEEGVQPTFVLTRRF